MSIKERIQRVSPYFKEMQIVTDTEGEQIIYVVVGFPANWIINEEISDKFNVTVEQGNSAGEYYFCAEIDTGQDAVFDAIEFNISKMKEAIERAKLLAVKTTELKALFEDETVTIESLRTLHFVMNDEKEEEAPIFPKRGRPKKQKEVVAEDKIHAMTQEEINEFSKEDITLTDE